jgi:hypothetical protein
MRDLVRYYIAQSGEEKALSAARDDPERDALLRRFINQESTVYLGRFYRTYHGQLPDEALATLAYRARPLPKRLAVVYLSVKPDASREELGAFLHRYLPHEEISDDDLWELYREYDVERFSLEEHGYLAGVHPLELWLVSYLQTHSNVSREEVIAASEEVRQEVYGWLYKAHSTHIFASASCWSRTPLIGSSRIGSGRAIRLATSCRPLGPRSAARATARTPSPI